MLQDIVVFERDERYTDNGQPELDFRGLRGILPTGSAPLAIADRHNFAVASGQWFGADTVIKYAEKMSGYRSEFHVYKKEISDLDGRVCSGCGQALQLGYSQDGKFREASFVPQQHGAAMACRECSIVWSVGAGAVL